MKRFWAKVDKSGYCWLWIGYVGPDGYGQCRDQNQRRERVHRVAWTLEVGPIPEGQLILHKCDMRSCVRPSHLYLGTYKDNANDTVRRGRHKQLKQLKLDFEPS